MNRMGRIFKEMMEREEKILILYFPVGDTILGDDTAWARKYFDNGCTVLEIGLPYEDPCLDGATVRRSMNRALGQCSLDDAFRRIAAIRKACPENILQIMTYHENCLKYGYERFAKQCADAGVDAVLCPNASEEALTALDGALERQGIVNMRFAPFRLDDRVIAGLKRIKGGYIFQQAVDGGTGARPDVSPQVKANIQRLKAAGITVPLCAGFGISNAEQARTVVDYGADGLIVGSAVITHIENGDGEAFIRGLREAIDR